MKTFERVIEFLYTLFLYGTWFGVSFLAIVLYREGEFEASFLIMMAISIFFLWLYTAERYNIYDKLNNFTNIIFNKYAKNN